MSEALDNLTPNPVPEDVAVAAPVTDAPAANPGAFEPPEDPMVWLVFSPDAPGIPMGLPVHIGSPFNLVVHPGQPFAHSDGKVNGAKALIEQVKHIVRCPAPVKAEDQPVEPESEPAKTEEGDK